MKYILIMLIMITTNSFAKDIYTCNVGGKTIYQGKPCQGSKEQANRIKEKQNNYREAENKRNREASEWNNRKEPIIGMTKSEVEKSKWGYPDKVNTTTTANNEFEQWVYRSPHVGSKYIHFTNGRVTSISQ